MPPRHVHAASAPSSNPRYSQCPHTNIHIFFFPSLFSPSFFPPGFVCGQAVLDAVRPGLVDGNPRGLVWLDATSGRADAAAALAEDLWDQHSLRYLDCVSGFYGRQFCAKNPLHQEACFVHFCPISLAQRTFFWLLFFLFRFFFLQVAALPLC